MSMTVKQAAELLDTDATTFIISAMSRCPEAEAWTEDTELPEQMIEELEAKIGQYKTAAAPDRTVASGSNFDGSLVKATGDAVESAHLCAEALQFAFHELDPAEIEQWVAMAAMSAANKIQVFEDVEAQVLGEWRNGRSTRAAANLQQCLKNNQSKVNEILQRHNIKPAAESLGNSQRHQAATTTQTSQILKQVLAVSARTK